MTFLVALPEVRKGAVDLAVELGKNVFVGEGSGQFSAFDSRDGTRLWHFNCGAGVNAPPVTYELDGVQYVTVAAGGNSLFGFRQGDAVFTFALPRR